METLGNTALLGLRKIGYFASGTIASLSVLPTLDWAAETAGRDDVAVVSGFHSKMERQVLDFLLRGKCGIIHVMARGIYKKPVAPFLAAFDENRVLFITNEKASVARANKETCRRRNEYAARISDELVLSCVRPASSLYRLSQMPKPIILF